MNMHSCIPKRVKRDDLFGIWLDFLVTASTEAFLFGVSVLDFGHYFNLSFNPNLSSTSFCSARVRPKDFKYFLAALQDLGILSLIEGCGFTFVVGDNTLGCSFCNVLCSQFIS